MKEKQPKRATKKGYGSRKGGAFERDVCKMLSLWWTAGAREDCFWRTGGSGGRATARAKKGKKTANQEADVMACDPLAGDLLRWAAVELKRGYPGCSLQDLLDTPAGRKLPQYAEWFAKTEATRSASGALTWAVIVRRDQKRHLIVTPDALIIPDFLQFPPAEGVAVLHCRWYPARLYAMPLDLFLACVSPNDIARRVASAALEKATCSMGSDSPTSSDTPPSRCDSPPE